MTGRSVGPARPVSGSVKTLASVSDQMLGHLVTGRWRGASGSTDVAAHRGGRMTGRWVSPVRHDQMRPVVIFRFWMFTGNNQTLRSCVRSLSSSTSGHTLNVLMTVEIGR